MDKPVDVTLGIWRKLSLLFLLEPALGLFIALAWLIVKYVRPALNRA